MENIFCDINNFVYLDDILLTDSSRPLHLANIEKALTKANTLRLRFSLPKCLFFQKSLEYLGLIISKEGVRPNLMKAEALAKKETPKNGKELRSFLGAANYCRKHIPAYSSLASILYDTIGSFVWTIAHTEAFEKLKAAIVKACTLSPPDSKLSYTILTDASNQGLGAALVQDTKPIAFASRTLKKAELMYALVQLEALGLVFALKQFSPYIYGKRTTVLTDQHSLISLLTKSDVSNILNKYKNFIMGFDLDIRYIKGTDNLVADYLSRSVFNITLTSSEKKELHDVFPEVTNYLQQPFVLSNFTKYLSPTEKEAYPDGKIVQKERIRYYVSQNLRFFTLRRWHEHPLLGNHNGFDKGIQKLKEVFAWPGMDNDVKRTWTSCDLCLKNKPHGTLQAKVNNSALPTPPVPFHTLSLDYLVINEKSNVLVIIDEFSKFVALFLTNNMRAISTVSCLKILFYLLGFPHTIKTDNGPAFLSNIFETFCNIFGITHYLTTVYNHQSNSIIERFNRTIRETLRIYDEKPLHEILHNLQYAHNFSNTTTQEGKPKDYLLSIPDKFMNETYVNTSISGRGELLAFIKHSLRNNSTTTKEITIIPNDTLVYKKDPTAHKNEMQYKGPYKIIEHVHGDTYLITPVTKYMRNTGKPERCISRQLKIAPTAVQNNPDTILNQQPIKTTSNSNQLSKNVEEEDHKKFKIKVEF